MSFRPEALRGAPTGGAPLAGQVTYRLARNAVVAEFQKGRLSRMDVCDAHPELVRAAKGVGETTDELCPICEEANVSLVSYAFGPGLPANGKLVTTKSELSRARSASRGDVACYVVEVCPACSWNHLAQTFHVPSRRYGKTGPAGDAADALAMMSAGSSPLLPSTDRAHPAATPEEAPQS